MRIVITGYSGNLGTALVRHLRRSGEHELVGISRRQPPDSGVYAGIPWHHADLADTDSARAAITRAVRGAGAVVHLAWAIQPSHKREWMRRVNVDGTRLVAEAARSVGAHLVVASSIGAYSPGPGRRVDETWPTNGVASSAYSVDKAACETLLDAHEPDLLISRIRPTLVLQPDAASEIARYFVGRLVPVSVIRPGLRWAPWPTALAVQFVHADDVAAAITTVLTARAGGAFNVAAEPPVDRTIWRELFGGVGPAMPPGVLRSLAALTWRLRLQPTDAGWVDLAFAAPLIDCDRLRGLGWEPRHRSPDVLHEFLIAFAKREGGPGPLLYPRTLAGAVRRHA